MSFPEGFDEQVALLLPLHLRGPRDALLRDASRRRPTLKEAWPSLRQANWLGEEAARATSVQDILKHLEQQGPRWADKEDGPRLHEIIVGRIGDRLKRDVDGAIRNAAAQVAEILNLRDLPGYVPDEAWVVREHLSLARLYIGTLVTWRRIDMAWEEKT
jgi:hypothetical protein